MSRLSCVSSQSPSPKKGKEGGREGGREEERIRQFGNTHSGMFLKEEEKGVGSERKGEGLQERERKRKGEAERRGGRADDGKE